MPRMRMLKPGFFANDVLAEVSPLGRLLFAGIWCMADREGRLEDRPKKIKAEILRYDSANVDRLLNELAERGFIVRYEIAGARFIQVVNFRKHQTPNVKEPASIIPAQYEHGESTVPAPTEHQSSIASRAGVSDSQIQEQIQEQIQREDDDARGGKPPNGSASAASAARPVVVFDQEDQTRIDSVSVVLAPLGLNGDPLFWRKVLDTGQEADLEAEAIKMADWQRQHRKRSCSQRFVLNWLEKYRKEPQHAASRNGTPENPERFAVFRKFA